MKKKNLSARMGKLLCIFSVCCFIAAFVFYFIVKVDLLGIIWRVAGAIDGLVAGLA